MHKGIIRKRVLSLEKLAALRKPHQNEFTLEDDRICLQDKRDKVFARDGYRCRRCGIRVTIAAQEKHKNTHERWHINFYAEVNGGERLMTIDHIFPRAQGGGNHEDNLQVLCSKCNFKKGGKLPDVRKGDRCTLKQLKQFNCKPLNSNSLRLAVCLSQDLGVAALYNSLLMPSVGMLS